MARIEVRVRVDFGTGQAIGPGKVELLQALDRTGSLSQAAREMDMSYRRAWLLLKALNGLTDVPVVTSVKGGTGGGGATLTPAGRAVIAAYQAVEAAAEAAAQSQFRLLAVSGSKTRALGVRRLSRKSGD